MLLRIWTQHKRFLLMAGSGLAVFLVLNAIVSGYVGSVEGPRGLLAQLTQMDRSVRDLHKSLAGFWNEKARLETYEMQEEILRSQLELQEEEEFRKFEDASPVIQFNQAIERTWGQNQEKANLAGVALPERPGPEGFLVNLQKDGRAEYESHYRYLGIVRRALPVLIECGMSEIGTPRCVEPESWPVLPGSEDALIDSRGVQFQLTGPYEAFVKTLERVQEPRSFLQARIVDLRPKGAGDERSVKGTIEFLGLRLLKGAAAGAPDEPRPAKTAPRRTRRVK